jgi:3-oxoacyl-[acyl-carrier-protein] synthase II
MTEIVITGIGVNSPIGSNFEECFANIENGYKGLGLMQNIETTNFPTSFSGEVKKNGEVCITPNDIDRKEVFINQAFSELTSKNNFLSRYQPEDRVINIGAGIDYFDLIGYINSGDSKNNHWAPHCNRSYEVARKIAHQFDFKGGCIVNVSACVASTQALGLSYRMLKSGKNLAIVSGGYDSMLSHLHYMGFYKLGALSSYQGKAEDSCKPFDKKRCGLVIGEGGIAILLENKKNANKDSILAQIVGYSSTLDAFTITDPEPNGTSLAKAALEAIHEAGITPDDIDCAHMHETGTIKNALAEAKVMQLVFGDRFREVPVYSMKGQIGHLIGACGAMEMLGVIYSLKYQKVPPTVNFDTPDPEVPVRVITGKALDLKINYILKLNAAFGGQNTALVIKKCG